MERYQLRLTAIPEESRASVVGVMRKCGPPLDRRKLNSVLMGQATPPVTVAHSSERGPIEGLYEILSKAGCVLEIIDEGGATQALAGVADTVIGGLKKDPKRLRIALGGSAVAVLAGIIIAGVFCSSDPEVPVERMATATTTTSTTPKRPKKKAPPKPKPTPFTNVVAQLDLDAPPCPEGAKPFACLLELFREVHPKLPKRPPPPPKPVDAGPVDAGPDADAGPSVDAGPVDAATGRPKALDDRPYLAVFEHRFERCLAEERSRAPSEDDKVMLADVIWGLRDALIYRHGRLNCTDDRTAMYDCMIAARQGDCDNLYGRLLGGYVELGHRAQVTKWRAAVANALGDKILSCVRSERNAYAGPIERAKVHVFRYQIASALRPKGKGCTEDAFVACSTTAYARPCDELSPIFDADPAGFVRGLQSQCKTLSGCE